MNKCILCGKIIASPLKLYCADCEFEIKRVRLLGEESVYEYIARIKKEYHIETEPNMKIANLTRWVRL